MSFLPSLQSRFIETLSLSWMVKLNQSLLNLIIGYLVPICCKLSEEMEYTFGKSAVTENNMIILTQVSHARTMLCSIHQILVYN